MTKKIFQKKKLFITLINPKSIRKTNMLEKLSANKFNDDWEVVEAI